MFFSNYLEVDCCILQLAGPGEEISGDEAASVSDVSERDGEDTGGCWWWSPASSGEAGDDESQVRWIVRSGEWFQTIIWSSYDFLNFGVWHVVIRIILSQLFFETSHDGSGNQIHEVDLTNIHLTMTWEFSKFICNVMCTSIFKFRFNETSI